MRLEHASGGRCSCFYTRHNSAEKIEERCGDKAEENDEEQREEKHEKKKGKRAE